MLTKNVSNDEFFLNRIETYSFLVFHFQKFCISQIEITCHLQTFTEILRLVNSFDIGLYPTLLRPALLHVLKIVKKKLTDCSSPLFLRILVDLVSLVLRTKMTRYFFIVFILSRFLAFVMMQRLCGEKPPNNRVTFHFIL